MTHLVADRVLETTTTTGTGALALSAAVTGFRRFSAVCSINDTVPYFIEAVDSLGMPSGDYEYGIGTYSATNELTRTTVQGSSNADAAVNFAAGSKNVGIAFTKYEYDKVKLTSGTALTVSGATNDFTSIPSWAKRITVSFSGVSTNGTSLPIVQLGDAGGVEAVDYAGAVWSPAGSLGAALSTGFAVLAAMAATTVMHGSVTLTLVDASTNTWAATSLMGLSAASTNVHLMGGSKSLSATLDRIRVTTVNGTDTFDAGKVNILYEGS